jgi:hypothetical protein
MDEAQAKRELQEGRNKLWGEIRQLVLNEGPLAEEVSQVAEEFDANNLPHGTHEALIAHLIAARCAEIAKYDVESAFAGEPVSMVLGKWAGFAFDCEIDQLSKGAVDDLLTDLGMTTEEAA